MNDTARQKRKALIANLRALNSLLVAFSGGVDSAFLLAAAHEALRDRAVAATAVSPIHSQKEFENACTFAEERGIRHIRYHSHELEQDVFTRNPVDRCYHCKKLMIQGLFQIARDEDLKHVAHGANVDDFNDFRPGFKAADETGVLSPLIDVGLNKADIRFLSKEMGLSTWDRPSMACLASRIPYGSPISENKLQMIEAAETFLFQLGFKEVRVRHGGTMARIELSEKNFHKIMEEDIRKVVVDRLHKIGFFHIALDLEGYISGKMNRDISRSIHIGKP